MQMLPPEVDTAHKFTSNDLVARIQEIAPESTQIPASVSSYNVKTQLGGVANPVVAGFDYAPMNISSEEYRAECNDVRTDCRRLKDWADGYDNAGSHWSGMSWCYNRPRTRSTRTLSKAGVGNVDPSLVTFKEGRSFVSACRGETVRFKAVYKCPNGKWYRKYNKLVNEYERVDIQFGSGTNFTRCGPVDLRFKVREGTFVSGGAYVVSYLTY